MQNIIDYADMEYRSFDEKPFCRVDSLLLSQLAYIEIDEIFNNSTKVQDDDAEKSHSLLNRIEAFFNNDNRLKFLKLSVFDLLKREYFEKMFGNVFTSENTKALLIAVACSPRFRNMKLAFYVNENDSESEKQFSAITFILNDASAYVAFRGTDTSIVGWKEDFNMAYAYPVPAQVAAYKYLDEVADYLPRKLFVGGHSKGGNLAVYSVLKCRDDVSTRVESCFSHDGPGFREELVKSDEFKKIEHKVFKTVPADSIIGMLMQNHDHYQVIKSSEMLLGQHDAFTWDVRDLDFVDIEEISKVAKYTNLTITQWIENMPSDKGQKFIDELFNLLLASNFTTFTSMKRNWKTAIPAIYKAIDKMDPDTEKVMKSVFDELALIMWRNL